MSRTNVATLLNKYFDFYQMFGINKLYLNGKCDKYNSIQIDLTPFSSKVKKKRRVNSGYGT